MSDNRAPAWVIPVMRTGFGARALVYLILGVLTFIAAWTGREAEGTTQSLENLRSMPLGVIALWVIAAGLLAYCVWRLICASMDLEDEGHDAKGIVARGGQAITGLLHLGIAVSVARIAMGGGQGGDSTQSLASWLLQQPYGKFLVGAVGLVTIGAGGYYAYKGIAEKYKERLRRTATSEKLDPVIKAGLVAHGGVIALIGLFLLYAGITADSSQAGGVGQAFQTVRSQPYGQILLGLTAIGMVCFAVYCAVEAVYRIVPRRAGSDVRTLARKAEAKGKQAAASA